MANYCKFSQWLDEQLQKAGMSGKELALMMGVSEATISRIKHGRVSLTPKMKARLAKALNAAPGEVPSVGQVASQNVSEMPSLWVIQHSIPDHASVNYALKQGLFQALGIRAEEIADRDLGLRYPLSYFAAIKDQLARGKVVLAVGTDVEFKEAGLNSAASILSHTYQGYHMITRARTGIPSLEDAPIHQRTFVLKMLLEQMANAQIWQNGFERFSWMCHVDLNFLKMLRELCCEITGISSEDLPIPETFKLTHNPGLGSLDAFGTQGSDFVLADAGALAEAYSHPERYKVLLGLDKLRKTIEAFSTDMSPSLISNLKKTYRADNAAVAIERFKRRWKEKLAALEIPVYWHVFFPPGADAGLQQRLVRQLTNVLQSLQQNLAAPQLRSNALSFIKDYCDERACYITGVADANDFKMAWENCYSGL